MTFAGALLTLIAAVSVGAHFFPARSAWTIAIVAFSPYLAVAAIPALLLFGLRRGAVGWTGCAIAAVLLAAAVILRVPLYVAQPAPAAGADLVVMTSNLQLGSADAHVVVATAQRNRVDVVMLEELTVPEERALDAAGIGALFPYRHADPGPGGYGTGLWSRWPLENATSRHDFTFAFVVARVAVPDAGPVTAVALHLAGPTPQADQWDGDVEQLPVVLRELSGTDPTVAAGDFNATYDQPQFRRLLRGGYADGADQAGAGYLMTFPSDRWFPPLLAIDHVLTRHAVATSVRSVEIPGTDHRALIATIRLRLRR